MSRASARWNRAHPDRIRGYKAAYRARLRAAVFGYYGETCACCGSSGDLTLDHLDSRGHEHREAIFRNHRRAGCEFYAWLVKRSFPPGYQTLCRPCGASKARGERCRLDHDAEGLAA